MLLRYEGSLRRKVPSAAASPPLRKRVVGKQRDVDGLLVLVGFFGAVVRVNRRGFVHRVRVGGGRGGGGPRFDLVRRVVGGGRHGRRGRVEAALADEIGVGEQRQPQQQ